MHSTEHSTDRAANRVRGGQNSSAPLTKDNLDQCLAGAMDDNVFEETQIRQEGIQQFERAKDVWLNQNQDRPSYDPDEDFLLYEEANSDNEVDIESLRRHYPPVARSSALPAERFFFVSPPNDPDSIQSRSALADQKVSEGSLSMLDVRADATRNVAGIDTPDSSSSNEANASDTTPEPSQAGNGEKLCVDEYDDQCIEDLTISYSRANRVRDGSRRVERYVRKRKWNDDGSRSKRSRQD